MSTKRQLDGDAKQIETTQIVFLSTKLFERGYRVFLYAHGEKHEIKIGCQTNAGRILRMENNLLNLFLAGEFDF